MRKFRRIFLPLIYLAIIICIKTSCENNLIANIPSYIEIEHFNYYGSDNSTIPHTDGYENYQSTNISDVWVSMDGQMLGVFEIPCKIPILEEGMHALDIYAGIKVNGISGARIKYPFYEKFETDVLLESENSLTLSPNTSYQNSTLFQFEEQGQFEMPGNMLEKSILSDTIAIIQDQVVFQGNKSVGIYLDSINTYFNIRNVEEIQLNNNSFLEFNFKSNINFNVGLIILNDNNLEQQRELIQLYATGNWKKIYLDLGPLISMGNTLSKFKIYFEGYYDNNTIQNSVYLDNLKLVFSE